MFYSPSDCFHSWNLRFCSRPGVGNEGGRKRLVSCPAASPAVISSKGETAAKMFLVDIYVDFLWLGRLYYCGAFLGLCGAFL